jgi:DNA-binding CsgD family transcriptional regulator
MMDNRFSKREQEIIVLLLQGNSNKQIALALDIASRTVEFHLGRIYAKLGVASRTEAVIKLSDYHPRESLDGIGTATKGNPQLQKSNFKGTFTKVFYHTHRSRRRPMKVFVRIAILLLLAVLITLVIVAIFLLIKQHLNPSAFSIISIVPM